MEFVDRPVYARDAILARKTRKDPWCDRRSSAWRINYCC